ncbi:MAG: putative DNA-binding protein (MmcQ/YjbR family) [Litorivivens sp.]|jgi:predicted DNA-binding protein (MmcQ/YjbR family)
MIVVYLCLKQQPMNIEEFHDHCLGKLGVTAEFPFDKTTLVFKVFGKMFALAGIETFPSMNLKCDPERSIDLRERYHGITPGFHMNKTHWNTVSTDGSVDDRLLEELINHSYDLVFASLTKKIREEALGK